MLSQYVGGFKFKSLIPVALQPNQSRDITNDLTELEWIRREYYNGELDNIQETDRVLEIYNL